MIASLPPASLTLKTRGTATTAAITCMILDSSFLFHPCFGYFFAGIFGAIALTMIIVSMAQGDQRGLPLLITHIIGKPMACLFASIVSCGALLGTMGTSGHAVAAPTPLLSSTPQPTIAAASSPETTAVAASTPAVETFPTTTVVSVITNNQWSGDAFIVL